MGYVILFAMITVPIVEISLFIEVGERIGLWPTIGTVIATAVLGSALLKQQGIATLRRFQDNMEQNVLPVREVFDGLCLLVAGALLLTPGFFTDVVGFCLFVPPFRAAMADVIGKKMLESGRVHVAGSMHNGEGARHYQQTHDNYYRPSPGAYDDGIIDGDFVDITDKDNKKPGDEPKLPPKN